MPVKKADKIKNNDEFTDMQLKFVYFYCNDENKNGAEAARVAGYSEKTAKQKASSLLKNKKICALIHAYEQLKQIEEKVNPKEEINSKFVLQQRLEILKSSMQKVPKKIWDYDKKAWIDDGQVVSDPRSASIVLRDIEQSLDDEKSNWSKDEINRLFEILQS